LLYKGFRELVCTNYLLNAVEPSFLGSSKITEFYRALGQFITYRLALQQLEPDRILYLAVPESLYDKFFATSLVQEILQQNTIYLITYDIEQEEVIKWIPLPNTVTISKPY
jgi:hypothetical protein